MRRGILAVRGGMITGVERTPCRRKPICCTPRAGAFRRRTVGHQIRAVERLGKRVILRLCSGDAIVMEPRMTGLVLLADPPTAEHLRFRITLSGCPSEHLCYWDRRGLGSVRLMTTEELQRELGPGRLGPDALEATPELLRERLRNSRRSVKVALLDQQVLAGIGNLYAAEILHVARIHPETPCARLTLHHWQRLATAMLQVLDAAIRYEGSTLSDGTYRNALNRAGGYQNEHRVYGKAGSRCPTCRRGWIRRIVQAQRSTFFCPWCQRAGRS